MKKLLVLVFIASAAMACSKSKPAPTTPTPPAGDAKMEGDAAKPEGDMKPEEKTEGTPDAADPCAPPK
jgi:hypothetical protein